MDAIEMEVKTMEKNITKIRTILSTTDTENISPEEHLEDIQVLYVLSFYPDCKHLQYLISLLPSVTGHSG